MIEELEGGNMNTVVRDGDTVLRGAGPWTPTVHALLDHLHDAGISGIPRPLGLERVPGLGRPEQTRERLTFIPGHVPVYPLPDWVWQEDLLTAGARLLRDLHDASASFPIDGRTWQQPLREPVEVVCHNDFSPHNLVFDDKHAIVGVIDWDMCSPGPRLRDLAVYATRAVPLTVDPPANGPGAADIPRRIRAVLDAYGSDATVDELLAHASAALRHLADHSRDAAARLDRPELAQHAEQYDRDASAIEAGRIAGAPA